MKNEIMISPISIMIPLIEKQYGNRCNLVFFCVIGVIPI